MRRLFGNAMLWLAAGALAASLLLVAGLVGLIAYHGLSAFWQGPIAELSLSDGSKVLGEIVDRESDIDESGAPRERLRIRLGNRDLGGADFRWLDAREIASESHPAEALVLEREEWGRFYGFPVAVRRGEEVEVDGAAAVLAALPDLLYAKRDERAERIGGDRAHDVR